MENKQIDGREEANEGLGLSEESGRDRGRERERERWSKR